MAMTSTTTALRLALAGAAMLALGSARADVRRCEDSAGHITYSNESCPEGTTRERPVEERPAVQVNGDGTPGKKVPPAKVTAAVPPPSPAAARTPEAAQEVAREQRKSNQARCDDLVRRIEYAQQDLQAASTGERASVELGLRRLQEEHEANCVSHEEPR